MWRAPGVNRPIGVLVLFGRQAVWRGPLPDPAELEIIVPEAERKENVMQEIAASDRYHGPRIAGCRKAGPLPL
jgi:hypothetical protein